MPAPVPGIPTDHVPLCLQGRNVVSWGAMRRPGSRFVLLLAPLLASALALSGCSSSNAASAPGAPKGLKGVVQSPGLPKPDFSLSDTSGKTFNLLSETSGDVTLLYFGYTHCPDVCPTHMANIAAALRELPPTVTSHIKVVFVTTDPARDTPPVLRAWLDHFDTSFIGLGGTAAQIHAAENASGMPASAIDPTDLGNGNYAVDHAAQVDAFTTDNLDHVVYPSGYTEPDWVNDLPKLVRGWPGP
jgi:protein SCO1